MADSTRGVWPTVGPWLSGVFWAGLALAGVACSRTVEPSAQEVAVESEAQAVVVDVATAGANDDEGRLYTGTTRPARQVSLRSQAEGRLLTLSGDVGDVVRQDQVLGTLDTVVLQTAVGEAQAELAARQFEVAQTEAELADIRTQIEQARVQLQQAANDAQRLQTLAGQGGVSAQEAEQAQTTLSTAQQAFQSAQEQVRTRQQAIAAAQQRVEAQAAIVRETQQRLSYGTLNAPLNGVVLERLKEPGDLALPGEAVLTLGDMANILVVINVTDSNLRDYGLGQSLTLQIDAFAGETFTGQVTRISPVADPASRQIPIEITVTNPDNRIGSGLLARVTGAGAQSAAVLVPQSALENSETEASAEASNPANSPGQTPTQDWEIFVVSTSDTATVVEARTVQIGERADGKVAILTGLSPGEQYVVRSSQPLQTGQAVELSLTSEG
ncbi:MAG: efflux RND transporter periplasmic adaptor subunit [Nodosilinea sp.]